MQRHTYGPRLPRTWRRPRGTGQELQAGQMPGLTASDWVRPVRFDSRVAACSASSHTPVGTTDGSWAFVTSHLAATASEAAPERLLLRCTSDGPRPTADCPSSKFDGRKQSFGAVDAAPALRWEFFRPTWQTPRGRAPPRYDRAPEAPSQIGVRSASPFRTVALQPIRKPQTQTGRSRVPSSRSACRLRRFPTHGQTEDAQTESGQRKCAGLRNCRPGSGINLASIAGSCRCVLQPTAGPNCPARVG